MRTHFPDLSRLLLTAVCLAPGSVCAQLPANGSRVINTAALAIAGTGKLDLADNDLIVRSGNLNSVTGLVKQAHASATWAGNGIVTSQSAASAPRTVVGYDKRGRR